MQMANKLKVSIGLIVFANQRNEYGTLYSQKASARKHTPPPPKPNLLPPFGARKCEMIADKGHDHVKCKGVHSLMSDLDRF